jgi:hypothetical protein
MNSIKCNKCGSKDVAEYLRGLPEYDDELQKQLDNKEVVLGGCCVRGDGLDAGWRCNECGNDIFENKETNNIDFLDRS